MLVGLSAIRAGASCPFEPRTLSGVLEAERRWVSALEERNLAGLDCVLDPSFADSNWQGELVSRSQVMNALPKRPASNLELKDLKANLVGNIAIIRGINTQDQGAKVIGSVRFVDVFVYRSHRWQAVSAQETLVQSR